MHSTYISLFLALLTLFTFEYRSYVLALCNLHAYLLSVFPVRIAPSHRLEFLHWPMSETTTGMWEVLTKCFLSLNNLLSFYSLSLFPLPPASPWTHSKCGTTFFGFFIASWIPLPIPLPSFHLGMNRWNAQESFLIPPFSLFSSLPEWPHSIPRLKTPTLCYKPSNLYPQVRSSPSKSELNQTTHLFSHYVQ